MHPLIPFGTPLGIVAFLGLSCTLSLLFFFPFSTVSWTWTLVHKWLVWLFARSFSLQRRPSVQLYVLLVPPVESLVRGLRPPLSSVSRGLWCAWWEFAPLHATLLKHLVRAVFCL